MLGAFGVSALILMIGNGILRLILELFLSHARGLELFSPLLPGSRIAKPSLRPFTRMRL